MRIPSAILLPTFLLMATVLVAIGEPQAGAAEPLSVPPLAPPSPLPAALPAAVLELHGTLDGQRFWARLKAPDPQFKGNRVLELVYTPPLPEQLAGAHLSDTPFVLVDDRLRVVAWNGRDTGSSVTPNAPTGYRVARDLEKGDGADRHVENERRTIAGDRGWDLHLAPVLLAFAWTADGTAGVRAVDLFGSRHGEVMTVEWKGTAVTMAGQQWTIVPGADGKVQTVNGADGKAILTVAGRL